MKKTILLFLSLIMIGQVAFSLTVNSTAGGLSTAITTAGGDLSTVTNLTVTGTIDARDFKTMYYDMTILSVLDLSAASIAEYSGNDGIVPGYSWNFQNEMPSFYVNFKGKQSLTSIICPLSLTAFGGFQDCKSLISVSLPSGITRIPDSAFFGCTGLNSINIPSKVTEIAAHAFSDCTGLTSITIPSSVSTINYDSFSNCSALISVDPNNAGFSSQEGVLYNKLKTILMQCPTSETGNLILPSTVTTIKYKAFYNCMKLSSVSIPSSVTSIGNYAFQNCFDLTSINIPSLVTTIGIGTFRGCISLTSITIPSLITSFGYDAFFDCTNLKTIYSLNAIPPILGTSCFNATSLVIDVFVPTDAAVTAYRANVEWIAYFPGTIIKKGVPSAVPTLTNSNEKVYTNQSAIIVEGTSVGETVSIYTLNGNKIKTALSQSDRLSIPIKFHGVYLVKIAKNTVKVVL